MTDERPDTRLVLWDVDHTLVETRGVGSELYRAAFELVTGRKMEQQADVTGKTEPTILAETLKLHGIDESGAYRDQYARVLPEQYRRHADRLRARGRALPGALDALTALAQEPTTVQTVLSGNYRAVAKIKLEVFGLADRIDLEVGAYGEDSPQRPELVAVAQRRAASKYGYQFARHNTVIIGDTVHDIAAAHQGGAAIIAIATGRDSAEKLREAGADLVLLDLTDTGRLVAAVMRATAHRDAGPARQDLT